MSIWCEYSEFLFLTVNSSGYRKIGYYYLLSLSLYSWRTFLFGSLWCCCIYIAIFYRSIYVNIEPIGIINKLLFLYSYNFLYRNIYNITLLILTTYLPFLTYFFPLGITQYKLYKTVVLLITFIPKLKPSSNNKRHVYYHRKLTKDRCSLICMYISYI